MKLITRDTDYAVRALIFLAQEQKRIISTSELVSHLRIPRPFLRKILQRLNKEKLLKSYKGMGGGFRLTVYPHRIFLLDLIEIFQGPLRINECIFRKRVCPNIKTCKLKEKIDSIQRYVRSKLKDITLEMLLKRE